MKTSVYIPALIALLVSLNSAAQNQTEKEVLSRVIEMERMIINWSPSAKNLGRVMTYTCINCPATVMTIDLNATLSIDGQPVPIETLANKVDWAGAITVTDKAPNHILKFSIY